jgi:hypothetical protein
MEYDELRKQAKVIDMMLTMHSILAGRYHRRAQLLEIALMAVSVILVALTFIDPQVLALFSISAEVARVLIDTCSLVVFFLSIVSLIVNWKGRATQHREAFNTLVPLKSEWRGLLSNYEKSGGQSHGEFARRSALILGSLIPIPDAQFNRLKAQHLRKVTLSTLISANPGSSVPLLRFRLWYRSNRRMLNSKLPNESSE